MAAKKTPIQFDNKAIRDWTLYVIRLTDGHYYVGITSRKDFTRRIKQHGNSWGARVNQGKTVEEIVEIQHLGAISALKAQNIENDTTLEYRKKFGARKVRGGYDIYRKTSIAPVYTPGSFQATMFILSCLIIALLLMIFIASR